MNRSVDSHLVSGVASKRSVELRQQDSQKKLKGLLNHHSQCELNYHRCMALMPGCRAGESQWLLMLDGDGVGSTGSGSNVCLTLLESAPYTTTVELSRHFENSSSVQEQCLKPSRLKVRLYHDVEMAEVVAWDRHRHWQPVYEYPNKSMYQPDEKMVLNRFLGELLYHYRKLGIAKEDICESIRINKH